jgi:hypothetical protein
MNRILLIVTACGVIAAVAFFAAARSLGPFDWPHAPWAGRHAHNHRPWSGPVVSRALPWNGGDTLKIELPATVAYTQSPTVSLTVTGPREAVDHVVAKDGALGLDRHARGRSGDLAVALTAPDVRTFKLLGAPRLTIDGFDGDTLTLEMAGVGQVEARGRARALSLKIAGPAKADLAGLAVETAQVKIAGPGDATLGPTASARLDIAGPGAVTLTTTPRSLEKHVMGPGRVSLPAQ